MPNACRPPFLYVLCTCISQWREGADLQTGCKCDRGRHIPHPSRKQGCLGSVTHARSLNTSKIPICSMEATDTSQLHGRPCNYLETLQWLLKLFLFWIGQNFTSRDAASEGPARQVVMSPQPYSLLCCSQTSVKLLSGDLILLGNKLGESLWVTAQRQEGKQVCASPVWRRAVCLKSISGQFQSKTYVQTKGPIYFEISLTAWKAFLMHLYLFGTFNGWLLPMKYISASEASLSSKPSSFLAQQF